MHKYFVSLALLSQVMFSTQASPAHPFAKLTPEIYKQVENWTDSIVTTLSEDLQLTYLNLFALNADGAIEEFIKCSEYIESQPNMLDSYRELGLNIMEIIRKYAENIQGKIALKKNITEKQKNSLWEKLETKIQELIAYINAIYYQKLYNRMSQKNIATLYMFNEKGLIPQEKRTRSLPQSV